MTIDKHLKVQVDIEGKADGLSRPLAAAGTAATALSETFRKQLSHLGQMRAQIDYLKSQEGRAGTGGAYDVAARLANEQARLRINYFQTPGGQANDREQRTLAGQASSQQ